MRRAIDLADVRGLLCDADGNLFPSEEPAFDASTEVTNGLLAELGLSRHLRPDELRALALGKNFRATARELAAAHGVELAGHRLERWVVEERRQVGAHLARVLRPNPEVLAALERLSRSYLLALVSSSATARLDACLQATSLAHLFPADVRFSAEDSLAKPASKPDPAIYELAIKQLDLGRHEAVAIEDSVTGVQSAVAAGLTTIGNLAFTPPPERFARATALREAGAATVLPSWDELAKMLESGARSIAVSFRRSQQLRSRTLRG